MNMGWITDNIGAIIGGFIVIAVAYYLFRPSSNHKKSENGSKAIVSRKGGKNEAEKSISSPAESVNEKPMSPVWKTQRYLLKKIRSMKKPDILSENRQEITAQTTYRENEQLSPTVDIPAADRLKGSPENHEENSETNLMIEVANEDTPEISLPVPRDDINSVSGEIEKTEVYESTDKNHYPEIDMSTLSPADENEVKNNQLETSGIDHEQTSEKPRERSNVFNLFTDVDEEESEISKFASNLDQVNVSNLLKEAENLQKHMRR